MKLKRALGLTISMLAYVAVLVPNIGVAQPLLFVRGTVAVSVPLTIPETTRPQAFKDIALPHASVFLVRTDDLNKPIASALSDLSGRFVMKTDQNGVFRLCVEAEGFERFCADRDFRFDEPAFSYGTLRIPMPAGSDAVAFAYGKVTLQDGQLPRGFAPFQGVNAYARIQMMSARGMRYEGFVNNFGEYIVPQIPVNQDFRLLVGIENETTERLIKALTKLSGGRAYSFDFVLPNSAPRIRVVSATSGGKPVQIATPGSTITLYRAQPVSPLRPTL